MMTLMAFLCRKAHRLSTRELFNVLRLTVAKTIKNLHVEKIQKIAAKHAFGLLL